LQTVSTYTDQASLALGVAEDFVHCALFQRVNLLTNKLIPVGRMYGTAWFGLEQDVREQVKHLGLCLRAFSGHCLKPAFPNVPPPYNEKR